MALKRAILDKIHAARVALRARSETETQDAVLSIVGGSKSTMVKYWQASNPETYNPQTVQLCAYCHSAVHDPRLCVSRLTKLALARKKAQGERTGEIPYGFSVAPDGKTLVEEASEQIMLKLVRREHRRGTSLRGIVALLAECGFTTRKGTPFSVTHVHRFVQRIRRGEGAV